MPQRETLRTKACPKEILAAGITPEQYYGLKVHLKALLLPGTPGFNGIRATKGGEKVFFQWFNGIIEEVGVKNFSRGVQGEGGGQKSQGLVWPDDRNLIYKTVLKMITKLASRVRANHHKKMTAVSGNKRNDKQKAMVGDEQDGSEMDELLELMGTESYTQAPDIVSEDLDWDEFGDLMGLGGLDEFIDPRLIDPDLF